MAKVTYNERSWAIDVIYNERSWAIDVIMTLPENHDGLPRG